MKKLFSMTLVLLLVFFNFSTAYAAPRTFSKINRENPQLLSSPIYIVGPYDINSDEGYVKYTDSNGDYYVRVRETKLVKGPADTDPVVNYKRFGIVYRTDNFSGTLSQTVSITQSVSNSISSTTSVGTSLGISSDNFSSNVSMNHSFTINGSIGESVTRTYSSGFNYGFPTANAPENCTKAERGVGFQFNTYRSLIDIKKYVRTYQYVDIVGSEFVNECVICNRPDPRPIPDHVHEGFVGYIFTLADGREEYVEESTVDHLITLGKLTPDMSQWRETVYEWKTETIEGQVKVPVDVMVTIYYDKDGNILDENGNIITP